MLDYILTQTKQNQLIYVGHSQGVTSAFVMLSERPEYNKRIALLVFEFKQIHLFNLTIYNIFEYFVACDDTTYNFETLQSNCTAID